MSLIVKNSVIYLIANITNAVIPFLLLPILTRFFTQEEYGQIAMYQVLIGGLGAFIGLNTVGASARKYYDQGNTSDTIKKYNINCLWNLIASSIIVSLIILLFEEEITNIINVPVHWLYLSICMCIASYLFKFLLSQWQVRGKAKEFGLLQVSKSAMNVLLSLFLVMFFLMGPEGRIYGQKEITCP
ncbi:lipopolysaccharide biosynthesis protein [Vibrio sp. 10N.261.54.A5]|uniref:lipopolysaccharide biosynthesis protein n=1 Tax=Vibrio sp. 10N.261.54.A5 TaxID=3229686 RepID=UPI003552C887